MRSKWLVLVLFVCLAAISCKGSSKQTEPRIDASWMPQKPQPRGTLTEQTYIVLTATDDAVVTRNKDNIPTSCTIPVQIGPNEQTFSIEDLRLSGCTEIKKGDRLEYKRYTWTGYPVTYEWTGRKNLDKQEKE